MIIARPYMWGDRQYLDGKPVHGQFIGEALTMVHAAKPYRPIATGGLIQQAPGNHEVWMVMDREEAGPSLVKMIRRTVQEFKNRQDVLRLSLLVDPNDLAALRFAGWLGFKQEAVLASWWNGEDRILMGWLK